MSIKSRLLLSYIAMLIIPIVLTIIVAILSVGFYFGDLNKSFSGKYGAGIYKDTISMRDKMFPEIKTIALKNPDMLTDENFLKSFDKKIYETNSSIIIRRNDELIYTSPLLGKLRYELSLPQFGNYSEDIAIPYKGEKRRFILSQHDFYFSNRDRGSVFFITDFEPIKSAHIKTNITVSIFVIIILIVTNGLLTYFVARSIVNPLNKLKLSANKIKEGDLDFIVKASSGDEIGDLCNTFEEMREKLKESVETQLQYENNRKELISNISHDLKTPITAIKGYVEGIRDGVADTPEKLERYINTIHSKANDIDKLINELFLYSKLDLNKFPFDFTKVVISKYFSDLMDELKFDLNKKDIALNYYGKETESVNVIADVQQLKRVVMNVIENSIKYMDKDKGTIDIYLKDKEDRVEVEIKDNGQGISSDELLYIFDRFYRTDKSRNTTIGGSGIGLSIAKKIIEEHGGQMWAGSIEGVGTSIFFTLKKYKSGGLDEKNLDN